MKTETMEPKRLDLPSEAENQAALNELFAEMRASRDAVRAGLPAACEGIATLVAACRQKTGQSYKIRALLFSLWNGKPASLLEIVGMDRALREALLAVMAVFGCDEFFYDAIGDAFNGAGLLDWFCEESEVAA